MGSTNLHQGCLPWLLAWAIRVGSALLSIGKLGVGGARYYSEGLGAVDEYYREVAGRSGVWVGGGAGLLALDGEVDPGAFSQVGLYGRDPSSGDRLGGPGSASAVPGFDLCFRAPKSVSLLQALGDHATAAEVIIGHREAVADALGYVERAAVWVRRGHAGATVVPGGGLVGAAFEHFTSRAGDPHLHSHVVVANVSVGPDGRWSALDGRALYRHAKTAGYCTRRCCGWSCPAGWGAVGSGGQRDR
jgi:conjugative relaxase-like TrwC/TraI family protein